MQQPSEGETLVLHELEFLVETSADDDQRIRSAGGFARFLVVSLLLCAAASVPAHELAEYLTSGFPR